jgi:uncharacterized protein
LARFARKSNTFTVQYFPMPFTVASLHIYPVKGLKGIDLDAARCTERGLENDRRWMVVDAEGEFLSQREVPKMATIWTDLSDGALTLSAPDMSSVDVPVDPRPAGSMRVQVWNSNVDAVPVSPLADAFLSEYLGTACRLVYMPDTTRRTSNPQFAGANRLVSFADGYAYLVTGEGSLENLNARLAARGGRPVPMNRFRPNIVVAGASPFAEDHWKAIRVGDAMLRAAKPCGRCQVPTTDQTTGERTGPEPLATLETFRDKGEFGICFGMNFVTEATGTIRVGDAVEVGA